MRIIPFEQIKPIIDDKQAVLGVVKQGFVHHAQGRITLPDPVQILFGRSEDTIAGDCHIKTASSDDFSCFCIKVATGFYANPMKGLPVNNGLVMLMSSETGEPLALFQDNGYLTSIRTAAAGALAASLVTNDGSQTLGVIGTGHQAQLQARWISETNPISKIIIWGRSEAKVEKLKSQLDDLDINIDVAASISDLCQDARIIVTTTPAQSPLIFAENLRPGHHIIAMGADSPGKIELGPEVLKQADVIVTDDHDQCLHHGEFGHAVRAGLVDEMNDISFGMVLENPESLNLNDQTISVIDLTGLGAQDLAIASMVYDKI